MAGDKDRQTVWAKLNAAEKSDDVYGFLRALPAANGMDFFSKRFQELQRMIERRLQQDRDGFLGEVLGHSTSIVCLCIVRMNAYLLEYIARMDKADDCHCHMQLPETVTDKLLPSLQESLHNLMEIEQIQAGLERQHELTRGKRLANDQAASRSRSTRRRGRDRPNKALNGHAAVPPRPNQGAVTASSNGMSNVGQNRIKPMLKTPR